MDDRPESGDGTELDDRPESDNGADSDDRTELDDRPESGYKSESGFVTDDERDELREVNTFSADDKKVGFTSEDPAP